MNYDSSDIPADRRICGPSAESRVGRPASFPKLRHSRDEWRYPRRVRRSQKTTALPGQHRRRPQSGARRPLFLFSSSIRGEILCAATERRPGSGRTTGPSAPRSGSSRLKVRLIRRHFRKDAGPCHTLATDPGSIVPSGIACCRHMKAAPESAPERFPLLGDNALLTLSSSPLSPCPWKLKWATSRTGRRRAELVSGARPVLRYRYSPQLLFS